jgi:hypothetical protein
MAVLTLFLGLTLGLCFVAVRARKSIPTVDPSAETDRPVIASSTSPRIKSAEDRHTVSDSGSMTEGNPASVDPFGGADNWEEIFRRVREWAAQDQEGVLKWAAQLPTVEERQVIQAEICNQTAEHNPAGAVALAESLHFDEAGNDVLPKLVERWASTDLPAAQSWVNGRLEVEDRERYLERIASVMSQTVPLDAARLVAEQISPGPVQFEAAMAVLRQWAARDYAGAATWVERFPEGAIRDRALAEMSGVASKPPPPSTGGTN